MRIGSSFIVETVGSPELTSSGVMTVFKKQTRIQNLFIGVFPYDGLQRRWKCVGPFAGNKMQIAADYGVGGIIHIWVNRPRISYHELLTRDVPIHLDVAIDCQFAAVWINVCNIDAGKIDVFGPVHLGT